MSAPRRAPRRKVDGVLLLDKPQGLSSNTALQIARRLLNAEKAGHTGTLDPMATGLLPLCFGEATKFSGHLLNADKTYLATLKLGQTTTTGDAEGELLESRPVNISPQQIEDALAALRGAITQIPPMYSALKRDGKPLYEYARAGIELERAPREVVIHALSLLVIRDESLDIEVRCSKGTYIRTLAEDIGKALGCGAHLTALRRTETGGVTLAGAVTLTQFEAIEGLVERDTLLAPVDFLLASLPEAYVDAAEADRLLHGQATPWSGCAGIYRGYAPGPRFIGMLTADGAGLLQPKRLVSS